MSRLLKQKIRTKELRFRSIAEPNPVQQQRQVCKNCGRLAYATPSGQLVDYRYSTAKNAIGAPGIQIIREQTRHVCGPV